MGEKEAIAPTLRVSGLTKHFGGLTAVDHVDMEVYPGEVVGLLGDNGAGKSTLIKMISGVYHPDEGQIFFEGNELKLGSPMNALELGIETLYQDLALAENLNVSANIFLGRETKKPLLGFIPVLDNDAMHEEAKKVLQRLEIEIPSLRSKIKTLSGGQRQAVAISRSIYWNAKLLIMDEPTAALGPRAVSRLLELIKHIKESGISIIFISHRLQDIFMVGDQVIVLREGERVGYKRISDTTPEEIANLMVGAELIKNQIKL